MRDKNLSSNDNLKCKNRFKTLAFISKMHLKLTSTFSFPFGMKRANVLYFFLHGN